MLNKSFSNSIALSLLGIFFILLFFSALNDSATMDELAHIPAAYSYIALQDYRLNPEHPPLIKDLAAVPLLFLNLKFPTESDVWQKYVNGQWDAGRIFLYESGNNANQIIFWSRIPIMLLAILFGWLLFIWLGRLYGDKIALLTLFFFVFSPTILAHSRYVTTDLGAAFGFFLGLLAFHKFLEKNDKKSLAFAGLALGIAMLLKFSLFILIPLFIVFGLLFIFLKNFDHLKNLYSPKEKLIHLAKEEGRFFVKLGAIFALAALLIGIVYQYHVWNYPAEKQASDAKFILTSFKSRTPADLTVWMADKPVLRGYSQYLLGLQMVSQRSSAGNTGYYWGEVSAVGWKSYFPVAYLLKEQLAFHILTLLVLFLAFRSFFHSLFRRNEKNIESLIEWARDNFFIFMSLSFIGVYWLMSIASPLNIGVRHIMPTLPFIYFLVARGLVLWIHRYSYSNPRNWREWLYSVYERFFKSIPKYIFVAAMLGWITFEVIFAFPYYLPYYNVLAGGADNGYKFIVDSNYDWGQDLKRLKYFVEKNQIEKINIDYFGGGNPKYELGEKYEPWWSSREKPSGWFAISATFRQGAFGKPVKGFVKKPEDSYEWLRQQEPVARAGKSIFIYRF